MTIDRIAVDKCYRTVSGEIRYITAITVAGDVFFTSYRDGAGRPSLIEGEHMPGEIFVQDIEKEIPVPKALQPAWA
jgi:hypothetical protein